MPRIQPIGYTILLPASAIPGWPADVVLPSVPVWKRDYSGSVRRLVRDGVDTPLATLFVHAARTMPEDAEGGAGARSASEAFLYRRLDTLAESKGRFRINVGLPIPFEGFGTLEVDLLCADDQTRTPLHSQRLKFESRQLRRGGNRLDAFSRLEPRLRSADHVHFPGAPGWPLGAALPRFEEVERAVPVRWERFSGLG
jgi:hypothetical protein